MKKILFASFAAMIMVTTAMADGVVAETETVTTIEVLEYNYTPRYVSSAQVKPCKKPYAKRVAAKPVRVKTHTEVIDHYQVYQPVTMYKPMGKQIEKRIVPAKPCARYAF